jgi:DNA-binding MarR family transcriptional regulator
MSLPNEKEQDRVEMMQAHVRRQLQDLSGLDDTSGMELFRLMRMLTNLCEAIHTQNLGENDLSGPRWGLLLRLFAEERHGRQAGITPTSLSRCQRVHKNTISALLRGLEEQGLVQRSLDPDDRRRFRIQLTPAGRERVKSTAPQRIQHLNQMVSSLSGPERTQLIALLTKWYRSLLATSTTPTIEPQGG